MEILQVIFQKAYPLKNGNLIALKVIALSDVD
jgi:hypothetical protein